MKRLATWTVLFTVLAASPDARADHETTAVAKVTLAMGLGAAAGIGSSLVIAGLDHDKDYFTFGSAFTAALIGIVTPLLLVLAYDGSPPALLAYGGPPVAAVGTSALIWLLSDPASDKPAVGVALRPDSGGATAMIGVRF